MAHYPEHDKLGTVRDDIQKIGEFLEWLRSKYWICDRREYEGLAYPIFKWEPCGKSLEELLAEYFEIDLARLETERHAMLASLREERAANP